VLIEKLIQTGSPAISVCEGESHFPDVHI